MHQSTYALKHFISENINGILGTTIFHLVLIMLFLFLKIGKVREYYAELIEIEFSSETESIEDIIDPSNNLENLEMPQLDRQTISNIARNVSAELENEISTEKYEQELMEELGIEDLQPEVQEFSTDMAMVETTKPEEDQPPEEMSNTIVKDNTTVSYDLLNRWHKYIYVPAYKCKGGGTVILSIEVNQDGIVTSATVHTNISTDDPCLIEEAIQSARSAVFNASPAAPSRQTGSITYIFVPQ